jgi:hypothetical protein
MPKINHDNTSLNALPVSVRASERAWGSATVKCVCVNKQVYRHAAADFAHPNRQHAGKGWSHRLITEKVAVHCMVKPASVTIESEVN